MPKDPPKPNDTEACRLTLVVDDDPHVLDAVARILEQRGITCVTAESGARALQILQTSEIALILTDVRMPAIDGLELLRVVKRDYPRIRRLILTGRETAQIVAQGIELAHRSPLLKPVDSYSLFMAVDHELELYRLATAEGEKTNGSNGHATNR